MTFSIVLKGIKITLYNVSKTVIALSY